jgi:tetratricopeptide (TPR) repeat protein
MLRLPDPPASQSGPVKAWSEPVVIPTYRPMPADRNPMFLERRVYQGSRGSVYPLPFVDHIGDQKTAQTWEAIHLENDYLRVMVLPQLGGRVHVALDRTNGYDFIYRQNVIKPALVGLAGPWISGGIEFNWPQHHRPSTFLPVQVQIQQHADGSQTIWCSEHEPMQRMKGMHGVRLRPGRACLEVEVRLYNRTPFVQTFLWWANAGVRVHERYQTFFPPDVGWVADHARRAVAAFPLCDRAYYGVDYARRALDGVPADEAPAWFRPTGDYPANDLSWYANIPVPTSFMAMGSHEDFFGGYDHSRQAGVVHIADHHIAPGKKQWTWGNHEFGYAWDRNLTDSDGPYIELMAGVYTDNQPDFSFLQPGETKVFSQYWYPIQAIGPVQAANLDAAVSLRLAGGRARLGVSVTRRLARPHVTLTAASHQLAEVDSDLSPGSPLVTEASVPSWLTETDLVLTVTDRDGRQIIRYQSRQPPPQPRPSPAIEPPPPEAVASTDELYVIGLHLEQYRHATRLPEVYWREALRRDPLDSRCNTALGGWHLRRGEFTEAEVSFRRAIERLTSRNPNPSVGEAFYGLGLTLRYLGRDDEAYDVLSKAAWNQAWQSSADYALGELDCRRRDWPTADEHLTRALRSNVDDLRARDLHVMVLRRLGHADEAAALLRETLQRDPLDVWARYLLDQSAPSDTQTALDLALDLSRAGFDETAIALLLGIEAVPGTEPLVLYYLGYLYTRIGDAARAGRHYLAAADAPSDYCFPSRLEEIVILTGAAAANPRDARAPYYLGNLLYDRRRQAEATELWELSVRLDPSFSVAWRNLGIGAFNVRHQADLAELAYRRAMAVAPDDARLLYEWDQLRTRLGHAPPDRLADLERSRNLVDQRDDLAIELCGLYNVVGRHADARAILGERRFQPWEGGEGLVLEQHVRTHVALGLLALSDGHAVAARGLLEQALSVPESLGEARHLLAPDSEVRFWLGEACSAGGDDSAAHEHWRQAAIDRLNGFSEATVYQALALRRLGQSAEADRLLKNLLAQAQRLEHQPARIDYFATSLPALLLFEDDPQRRQTVRALLLQAQARFGLGEKQIGIRLLERVLELDPSHGPANELLRQTSLNAQREGVFHRMST